MADEQTRRRTGGDADPAGHADARWPMRTQRLLGELRTLCSNWLHEPLKRSLDHFDMSLHRQAQLTGSHLDQQQYLATRLRLRDERQAFDQRFIASIDQAFDRLGTPIAKAAASAPQTLSLLDPLEHELAAALDQLVARSEARGGPQLIELGYRFAVLIGAPPLESEALPIGPQAMAGAFREAGRTLGLPGVHELLLLQSLESSLIQGLAPLYELVNAHFCADGILPRLRPFALPRAAPRRSPRQEAPARPAVPVAATPDPPRETTLSPRTGTVAATPESSTVTDEELQAALAALQAHLREADERTRFDLNAPSRLREELLIQLNVGRPGQAARASLSSEQDDTVELIVRLFGQIARQLPSSSDAQTLLRDLQLPMLRMALTDRGFSEQHEHPARKVLGRIAEIARDWLDDAGGLSDRGLRLQLGQLIDRTGHEAPSVALYVSLLDDIEQYLAYLQHRTRLAERRQVDAMQGLERLEQARHRVGELLSARVARSSRGSAGQLDQAWSDVLALTLLRHGEQSPLFGTRLAVTDQLLGALPVGDRHKLQLEVEAGLRQIGLPHDELTQLARRMTEASRAGSAEKATGPDDLVMRLGNRPRPEEHLREPGGTPVDEASAGHATRVAADAPGPDVLRLHRHLRALPAGVWFEFADPSGGRPTRRRLVWYSPLTGHSLFVTRSGQRAEELGELQLAREIASARVHEIASEHEDVLDHAWRAVTRELGRQPHPPRQGGDA
jgi:hypothetical protein